MHNHGGWVGVKGDRYQSWQQLATERAGHRVLFKASSCLRSLLKLWERVTRLCKMGRKNLGLRQKSRPIRFKLQSSKFNRFLKGNLQDLFPELFRKTDLKNVCFCQKMTTKILDLLQILVKVTRINHVDSTEETLILR